MIGEWIIDRGGKLKVGREGLFVDFAFEAVEMANELIEVVACGLKGKIPGAAIINCCTTKGFFILGEAVPGVFRVVGGSDTPEVK